jgi:hypothetical protein
VSIYGDKIIFNVSVSTTETYTKTLSLDSLLKGTITKNTSLDALLKEIDLTETLSLDAILIYLQTQTTELDALLNALGLTQTTELDALLQELGLTETTELDALLQDVGLTETLSLDAILFYLQTQTIELDALLQELGLTETTGLDAILIDVLSGTATWGYDTGVVEDNILDFSGYWSGTGEIKGSGDAEYLSVGSGQYMELTNPFNFGVGLLVFDLTKYEAPGGTITKKYKNGDTEANCNADTWHDYTVPFNCTGWVKLRVEG